MISLGMTASDRITGFSGVVVGKAEYISGCTQVLLVPKIKEDGKRIDGEWFDIQRLEQVAGTETIRLDNGSTPGCDRSAPRR